MISCVHLIELYINGELMELESQSSLNLRMNNVLFDVTKTVTRQAEYSYSFDIPSTPNNDRILGYANNLSKLNKFHSRYKSQVFADGSLIFDGSLTIQKYDANKKMYTCNLVNIKIDTLDEIFGEMKMTDLHWDVDFDGAATINSVNANYTTKYFFPLVSYGVFQKKPYYTDEVGSEYTPKHTLDKYNKWWVESFYPSLNVLETIKRAYESKGYNVGGSAFQDPNINRIYASCNLADEQSPIYNLGNPKFGKVNINATWNNYESFNTSTSYENDKMMNASGGLDQDLTFPYEKIKPARNAKNVTAEMEYNFDTIMFWNMMDTENNSAVTVTVNEDTYMYDPNEMLVVIPADGWYKISMQVEATLSGQGTTFDAKQWTNSFTKNDEFRRRDVGMIRDIKSQQTPIEIQLIKNYDDNIELIKGKYNKKWATGRPTQTTYREIGPDYTGETEYNLTEWETDCPHQDPFASESPTKVDDMIRQATAARNAALEKYGVGGEIGKQYEGKGEFERGSIGTTNNNNTNKGKTKYNTYGFMHKVGSVMPYDQAVSNAFICGFSSVNSDNGFGTVAVQRDGYSWSKMSSEKNGVFCNVDGLSLIDNSGGTKVEIDTTYCENVYKDCVGTNNCVVQGNKMIGNINCCVYLYKNDRLEVVAIQRSFEDGQLYSCSGNCHLEIEAISSKSKAALKAEDDFGYFYSTDFPTKLNLFNFTNNETNVGDWINNIKTAFNLDIIQEGNNIDINTNQGVRKNISYAVDIDDRANSNNAISEYISYPREMSVQYKIDTDEWGFELTIPLEHQDDEGYEWKKWGDSGYTVIRLNDDTYETSTQNTSTQFSYTWYDSFIWKEVQEDGTETTASTTISIPTLSKAEYMVEGYGYDEAMKHDGYSLTQRFWYRDQESQEFVYLSDHMHEKVYLTYPMNSWDGFNLSYKDTEKSILTEYFQVQPMISSNYVKIDVYLSPEEYNDIKGGALVHFDSNLHFVSEIQGFDPQGANPTTLKLITKV